MKLPNELKNNLGKYLVLSATEDIFITKNSKVVLQRSATMIFCFKFDGKTR